MRPSLFDRLERKLLVRRERAPMDNFNSAARRNLLINMFASADVSVNVLI